MSYKVLEQNGVTNENVDGAGFNYFASGKRDGILGGILNECAVYSPASNIVSIGTGVISIQGFRVKITSDISWAVSGNADEYSIVFEIVLNPDRSVSSQFIAQPSSLSLIKNALLVDEEGTHQTEIVRFNWDGSSVSNISRKLPVIIAGSGSGGASIELAQDVEGDSTEKAVSQKAVKDALADKADRKFVEDGFVPRVSSTYVVYGTGSVEDGVTTQRYFSLNPFGNGTGDVVQWTAPDKAKFDTVTPTCTIGVADPIKPIQAANKRFVEKRIVPLEQGVYNALGTMYTIYEETSTGEGFSIPSGAMPYVYIESIGNIVLRDADGNQLDITVSVRNMQVRTIDDNMETYDIEDGVFIKMPDNAASIYFVLAFEEDPIGLSEIIFEGRKLVFQIKVGA